MAFCRNCGAQLEESYKFCKVCGTMVETPQPAYEAPAKGSQEPEQLFPPAEEVQEAELPAEPEEAPAQPVQMPVYPADYAYPQTPKKPGKIGWIIALVVAAVLIFFVTAAAVLCWFVGKNVANVLVADDDPNLGVYVGTTATMWGMDVDVNSIFPEGFVIELKAGGICRMTGGGENGLGQWSLEGNAITLYDGESTLVGTLEDGVMTFENMLDLGFDIVFYKQDAEEEISTEPIDADTDWWNGQWYGWWMTTSCEGEYASWEDAWWDCCAEITVDENGQGHLLLWDEDLPKDEPLAEIDLVLSEDGGTMGTATTTSGYFMDQNVSYGDYAMDPSQNSYENLLSLQGWYETGDGGFYFEAYLRPWGQLWDDMITENEGYAPYYYDKYVQAVKNGESAPEDIYEAWGE